MKALIVFDSYFGNTEKIAQEILGVMQSKMEAKLLKVIDVAPENLKGLDYLIVGSPTRAFSASEGIKKFLKEIPATGHKGLKVAAFDTRISVREAHNILLTVLVKIFGYAAEPMAKILQQKGGTLLAPPEGFIVNTSEGPLREGETGRASAWAQKFLE